MACPFTQRKWSSFLMRRTVLNSVKHKKTYRRNSRNITNLEKEIPQVEKRLEKIQDDILKFQSETIPHPINPAI